MKNAAVLKSAGICVYTTLASKLGYKRKDAVAKPSQECVGREKGKGKQIHNIERKLRLHVTHVMGRSKA